MKTPSARFAARALVAAIGLAALGCNDAALKASQDAGAPVSGLTAEQAGRVVAKVGERAITVGEFAKAIERMEPYLRLRYQSKERRHELLQEMVDTELLAEEARRRGVDKEPEAQEAIDQILRDAVLAEARKGVGAPAEIPAAEVRAYYDAHKDRFVEPERRRVAAIVVDDKKKAEAALKDALAVKSNIQWGELFAKTSATAPKEGAAAADLAGDLGVVGAPDDPKGGNPRVPEPVRAAAFQIPAAGGVLDHLVEVEGRFFVVRLNGVTASHTRSVQEADRSIRVILLQERIAARDKVLEEELRKKIPVEIDESALANVVVQLPPAASAAPKGDKGAAPSDAKEPDKPAP